MNIDGRNLTAAAPQPDNLTAWYDSLLADFDAAGTDEERRVLIDAWDKKRKEIHTWSALAQLRFFQDTANEQARAAKQERDELVPMITEQENRFKQRLLDDTKRAGLEQEFGAYAFGLWKTGVDAFDAANMEDMVATSKLASEYTKLLSGASFEVFGEQLNLNGLAPYAEDPDRQVRYEAEAARWGWFNDNGAELDRIFDGLCALRHRMAGRLGFDHFTPVGYMNMRRIDYGPDEVASFRDEVLREVVPVVVELRAKQAEHLGVDKLMYWDEGVLDPEGNPKPIGDPPTLVGKAQSMFDAMGKGKEEGLGSFFGLMREQHLMDLVDRPGKAPGGFCTKFPTYGVPFVFANFNGTTHDVDVLTHEIGHAYQGRRSRAKPLLDYQNPTSESAEIHSMSLEFLCSPHMEIFFEKDADRYRRHHLTQRFMFLAYGVTVDHFQHKIYAQPDAGSAQRHGIWKELEARYMPWRDFGDLQHPAKGGFWQRQRHIYMRPFYYIDYTLALTCALQFWVWSLDDYDGAMEAYTTLCARGGEAPFSELVKSAGLRSPFEPGCLKETAAKVRERLLD